MDSKELDELKWSQYRNRPSVKFEENDAILKESLNILDQLEERVSNGTDVINWEEKAEMDAISQKHPEISVAEDDEETPQNLNEQDLENSNHQQKRNTAASQEEQEAMSYLAGVMGELEGYDDKQ